MRKAIFILWSITFLAVVIFIGCTDYKGSEIDKTNPHINLYNNPPDSAVMGAAPVIWWWGTDRDGIIEGYEYIDLVTDKIDSANLDGYYNGTLEIPDLIISSSHDDTFTWISTESHADTIYLSLEQGEDTTRHLFCVRSIDIDNYFSDPVCYFYFRTNEPPDSLCIKENEEYPEGDTCNYWILDDFTYDWFGVPISWEAHDPDSSIILEYYWWVENLDSGEIYLTSKSEDSVSLSYCGKDPTDGWIRLANTTLKGEIPSGHCYFIIKVRDDAFYEGVVQDTFEFNAHHPYFDPSDPDIVNSIQDGTFEHKMLAVYPLEPYMGWDTDMADFYDDILGQFESSLYDSFESRQAIRSNSSLDLTDYDLEQYSIIYYFNLGVQSGASTFSPSDSVLDQLRDYVMAGGRIIFDGRGFFNNISDFATECLTNPYGEIPFDMFGITWMSDNASFEWAEVSNVSLYPNLQDLHVASDRIRGIKSMGLYDHFIGIPYSVPVYNGGVFGDSTSIDAANIFGRTMAVRFAKQNTRTALFAFPLYYCENDNDEVTDLLRETIEFVSTTFDVDYIPF